MKNLTLSLLAVSVLSGCGGSGSGDSKPTAPTKPTTGNDFKIVSTQSNVNSNSVFVNRSVSAFSTDQAGFQVADSIDEIDSEFDGLMPVFPDLISDVLSVKYVSDSVFLSTVKLTDGLTSNLISYIDGDNVITYELKSGNQWDVSHVKSYIAEMVSDHVVIYGDGEFYFIKDNQKKLIDATPKYNSVHIKGDKVVFIDANNNADTLNIINYDETVNIQHQDKFDDVLGIDGDEIVLSMSDDVECHPREIGVYPESNGVVYPARCSMDGDFDQPNPAFHMRAITKFDINSKQLKPWVWLTAHYVGKFNSFTYINGHVLFDDSLQDIREQKTGQWDYWRDYNGVAIPLVSFKDVCANPVDGDGYVRNINVSIKGNDIYCAKISWRTNQQQSDKSGYVAMKHYLDENGNYKNDGQKLISVLDSVELDDYITNLNIIDDDLVTFETNEGVFKYDFKAGTHEKLNAVGEVVPMTENVDVPTL